MKILITGGAGYIGSVFLDYIFEQQRSEYFQYQTDKRPEVVVIDNLMYQQTTMIRHAYRSNFQFFCADVWNDATLVKKWFEWADVCIPLACYVGMPLCEKMDQRTVENVNFRQLKLMADWNHTSQNKTKIIYPTTNSGYGIGESDNGELKHCTEETPLNPISLYGKTKVDAENYLLEHCPNEAICLRLATVFGSSPRMRMDLLVNDFVYQALKNKSITLFEAHAKRNYIHVRDIARTFVFVLNNFDRMKGQSYNVGLSSANLNKQELCEKIKQQIPSLNVFHAEIGEDPDKRNYIVSNEKLESLSWRPKYSLEFGIQELIVACETVLNVPSKWGNV